MLQATIQHLGSGIRELPPLALSWRGGLRRLPSQHSDGAGMPSRELHPRRRQRGEHGVRSQRESYTFPATQG